MLLQCTFITSRFEDLSYYSSGPILLLSFLTSPFRLPRKGLLFISTIQRFQSVNTWTELRKILTLTSNSFVSQITSSSVHRGSSPLTNKMNSSVSFISPAGLSFHYAIDAVHPSHRLLKCLVKSSKPVIPSVWALNLADTPGLRAPEPRDRAMINVPEDLSALSFTC